MVWPAWATSLGSVSRVRRSAADPSTLGVISRPSVRHAMSRRTCRAMPHSHFDSLLCFGRTQKASRIANPKFGDS